MFTNSTTGADISTLTYTADSTTHYVSDLPVNTSIVVTRGGSTVQGSPFNSGDAGIIEFSSTSGSAQYIVTAGEQQTQAHSISASFSGNIQ
jgi:hypothetical protein